MRIDYEKFLQDLQKSYFENNTDEEYEEDRQPIIYSNLNEVKKAMKKNITILKNLQNPPLIKYIEIGKFLKSVKIYTSLEKIKFQSFVSEIYKDISYINFIIRFYEFSEIYSKIKYSTKTLKYFRSNLGKIKDAFELYPEYANFWKNN